MKMSFCHLFNFPLHRIRPVGDKHWMFDSQLGDVVNQFIHFTTWQYYGFYPDELIVGVGQVKMEGS